MFKRFYGFLADQKLRVTNLAECFNVAKDYGKVRYDLENVILENGKINPEVYDESEPIFLFANDEMETYVAVFKNLFILYSVNENLGDRILQIYMKRPDDEWVFPVVPRVDSDEECDKESNSFDFDILNPSNVKTEVYVEYDVNVYKINKRLTRCQGENYNSGEWNKTFLATINAFIKKVGNFMEVNQIKMAYGG